MRCDEILANCVSYFNQRLRDSAAPYVLNDRIELYSLHIAKKNGHPKDDLPRILSLR